MNEHSPAESVVEGASTFTEFINLTGDITTILYLATHPEEKDEDTPPIVIRKQRLSTIQRQLAA